MHGLREISDIKSAKTRSRTRDSEPEEKRRGGSARGAGWQSASSGQEGECPTNSVRPRTFELTNPETSLSVNTAARALVLSVGGRRTARLSLRAHCSLRDCLLCPAPYITASLILPSLHACPLYPTAISPHPSSFIPRP